MAFWGTRNYAIQRHKFLIRCTPRTSLCISTYQLIHNDSTNLALFLDILGPEHDLKLLVGPEHDLKLLGVLAETRNPPRVSWRLFALLPYQLLLTNTLK